MIHRASSGIQDKGKYLRKRHPGYWANVMFSMELSDEFSEELFDLGEARYYYMGEGGDAVMCHGAWELHEKEMVV
jgi:hypothetical protein